LYCMFARALCLVALVFIYGYVVWLCWFPQIVALISVSCEWRRQAGSGLGLYTLIRQRAHGCHNETHKSNNNATNALTHTRTHTHP